MAVKDYDVAAAFQAIEYELINSFFRNMKKHKVDEVKEQKEWEMWQVKQLQELDLYKKRNAEKYGTKFTDINKTIAEMIRLSNEEGQMDQEAEILSAMEKGLKPQRAPEQMTAQFFRTNDRKLDTLINATVSDMERAEVAVLRKADDVYRKTIFNAIAYANTGAGTYEKAIDMATKDFMKAGLTCVEYKNGSKHTISDYADMAVRTANKRAYLQGEGAKRQEWGVHTVIVNKRLMACPHCMPFAGKVFIDDVWGGGTAADGDYPLLSEAVAAGLYHPRCKDSHTAYFPGITGKPKKYTKAEVKEAEKAEEQERKADYAERQAESYQRVADTRLDPENKRREQAKADRWKEFEASPKDIESYGDNSKTDIDYASAYTFAEGETKLVNKLLSGNPNQICDAVEEILNKDKYDLPESRWSKKTHIGRMDDMKGILGRKEYNCDITIREDQLYNVKTYVHENLHARSISRYDRKHRRNVYEKFKRIEEGTVEFLSQEICKKFYMPYSVSYPKRVNALRELRELIAPDMNDYDFAKKLIEIPTAKRYNYLKGKAKRVKQKSNDEISNRIEKNLFALRPTTGGEENE